MFDGDYKIRYISLPMSIRGVTVQDKADFFNIYINKDIGIIEQRIALMHEFEHIRRGDFIKLDVSLEDIENIHISLGDFL